MTSIPSVIYKYFNSFVHRIISGCGSLNVGRRIVGRRNVGRRNVGRRNVRRRNVGRRM